MLLKLSFNTIVHYGILDGALMTFTLTEARTFDIFHELAALILSRVHAQIACTGIPSITVTNDSIIITKI